MNTQDKFIAAVAALAKRHRLELINDAGYSNTGTLRVQRVGDFADILTVTYHFQDGSATLRGDMGGEPYTYHCGIPAALQAPLDAIAATLAAGAPYYSEED